MRRGSNLAWLAVGGCCAMSVACSDTFTSSDDGGDASGSQGGTGGSSGDGPWRCRPETKVDCRVDADCSVAVNVCDPCFSGSCSPAVAARTKDLTPQSCLESWERRNVGAPPSGCERSGDVACPESCAVQPACPQVACVDRQCRLSEQADGCPGSGGNGNTGGALGSGGLLGIPTGGTIL